MWIKICGLTTPDAVDAALEARVDAIGFVFAPSSRQVSPERAAQLAAPARGRVSCIAVTQHPTQRWIDEIVATFAPDCLQTDVADLATLTLPQGIHVLPVMRDNKALSQHLPPRLLLEGPVSGQGIVVDWSAARSVARRAQLVLAGGLNESNLAVAIEAVRPFGVDVSSGVEAQPGIKSPEKILRFADAARAAFAGLEETVK